MPAANPPELPPEAPAASPRPAGEWPEVMTSAEAAAYLRVSPSTLRLALLAGDIPGLRVGSNWRLLRSELDGLMATRGPSATLPGRSRERKGVKLGPRKSRTSDTGPPQPGEASEPSETAPE